MKYDGRTVSVSHAMKMWNEMVNSRLVSQKGHLTLCLLSNTDFASS